MIQANVEGFPEHTDWQSVTASSMVNAPESHAIDIVGNRGVTWHTEGKVL